jgi:hypothetical protein
MTSAQFLLSYVERDAFQMVICCTKLYLPSELWGVICVPLLWLARDIHINLYHRNIRHNQIYWAMCHE